MKVIIFDVDGVITYSADEKNQIIVDILKQHHLYNISGVKEIFELSLNRVVLLDRIYEIVVFDKEKVLKDINSALDLLESNPKPNIAVVNFIKNNYKNYIFFTNTSLPHAGLARTMDILGISNCFKKFFAGEDGTKVMNIQTIINDYGIDPDQVLFIDDTLSHINQVQTTGVHTLHFTDSNIDIGEKIKLI